MLSLIGVPAQAHGIVRTITADEFQFCGTFISL